MLFLLCIFFAKMSLSLAIAKIDHFEDPIQVGFLGQYYTWTSPEKNLKTHGFWEFSALEKFRNTF